MEVSSHRASIPPRSTKFSDAPSCPPPPTTRSDKGEGGRCNYGLPVFCKYIARSALAVALVAALGFDAEKSRGREK